MPSLGTRKLVPGLPEAVSVKRVSSSQYGTLGTLLGLGQGAEERTLGVSLRLSKKGVIDSIALATETLIFQLNVDSNTVQHGVSGLYAVLNDPRNIVVGVGMSRILLMLHRQLDLRARGADLPVMFIRLVEKGLPCPGDIVRDQLGSQARKYAINALWYGQSNDDLCLRAWLSAW